MCGSYLNDNSQSDVGFILTRRADIPPPTLEPKDPVVEATKPLPRLWRQRSEELIVGNKLGLLTADH